MPFYLGNPPGTKATNSCNFSAHVWLHTQWTAKCSVEEATEQSAVILLPFSQRRREESLLLGVVFPTCPHKYTHSITQVYKECMFPAHRLCKPTPTTETYSNPLSHRHTLTNLHTNKIIFSLCCNASESLKRDGHGGNLHSLVMSSETQWDSTRYFSANLFDDWKSGPLWGSDKTKSVVTQKLCPALSPAL